MKKHPLITCGLTALLAASASAELLVSEDYTYPNGGIATRNGGTGWGGAWTGAGLVADGRHEFSGNDYRPISTTFVGSSTAPLYFSADFVKTGTDTSYAAWLEISNNSTQNDNDVRIGLANDQFSVRLEDQGGTDPAGEFGTYTPGTTVTIVGKLEFDVSGTSERVTVWVDPTGVETAAVSHTLTGQNVGWVTPLFTQGVRISLSGGVASVDNIKMGTTWADVAGGQASSPLALTITPTTGSPGD
jgi:hypothetical protein